MSGIVAVVNLDGRPVSPSKLDSMAASLAHRGHDGTRLHCRGSVGLGHLALHSTPESVTEIQPWSDEGGEIWILFDGRTDNRKELEKAVDGRGLELRNTSDVELVLRSYQVFGLDFAEKILGDFALVIWDGRERRLIGARDIVGENPFFYTRAGSTLYIASEIRALLTQPEISRDPNLGMVAEHLADRVATSGETLFQAIYSLPPAHLLIANANQEKLIRYWRPDPRRKIRYANDREYGDHFREVLQDAVKCRLRSVGRIAFDLSGGLDSSSVVSVVQDLQSAGAVNPRNFEYLSLVFPGEPCDESPWIEAVERRWNLQSNRIRPTEIGPHRCRRQVAFYRDLPDYPNGAMSAELRTLARDRGCRVRITGLGGDEWLAGSPRHATDLIRKGRLILLARQLQADATVLDTTQAGLLWRSLVPLVPKPIRMARRRLRNLDPMPPWLGPVLREQVDLSGRGQPKADNSRFQSHAQASIAALLTNGFAAHRAEMEERAAAAAGLELREPFMDRRVIEFALALPEEQRWRGMLRKFVLRTAMAELLPPELLTRTDKAEFSCVAIDALLAADAEIFMHPRCAQAGWVDPRRIASMYNEFKEMAQSHRTSTVPHLWPLWKILGIEIWFQMEYDEVTGAANR
jgi:asparagine synthase (glutamine-hydrolysing)